jgi:hypothetical protein
MFIMRSEYAANLALQAKPVMFKDVEAKVKEIMSLPISFKERLAKVVELEQAN